MQVHYAPTDCVNNLQIIFCLEFPTLLNDRKTSGKTSLQPAQISSKFTTSTKACLDSSEYPTTVRNLALRCEVQSASLVFSMKPLWGQSLDLMISNHWNVDIVGWFWMSLGVPHLNHLNALIYSCLAMLARSISPVMKTSKRQLLRTLVVDIIEAAEPCIMSRWHSRYSQVISTPGPWGYHRTIIGLSSHISHHFTLSLGSLTSLCAGVGAPAPRILQPHRRDKIAWSCGCMPRSSLCVAHRIYISASSSSIPCI